MEAELLRFLGGAAGVGMTLWLLMRRVVMFRADHEDQMKAERLRCDEVKAVEKRRADEQMEAAELRIHDLQNRVTLAEADREAWKGAHAAEVQARLAAERAAAQMLDSHSISVQLLGALRDALTANGKDRGVQSGGGGGTTR